MGQKPATAEDRRAFLDSPEGAALRESAELAVRAKQPLFTRSLAATYEAHIECSDGGGKKKDQHLVTVEFRVTPAVVTCDAVGSDGDGHVLLAKCCRRYLGTRAKKNDEKRKQFALESIPGHDWEVGVVYVPTSQSDTGQAKLRGEASITSLLPCGVAIDTGGKIRARVETAASSHDANSDIPYKSFASLECCGLSTIVWEREDGDFDVAHYQGLEFQCGYICPADEATLCHTFRLPSNPIL